MRVMLTIRRKLIATVSLFLFPIIMLAALYVAQARKDINFASLERDGITYLRAVWPVLNQAIAETPDRPVAAEAWAPFDAQRARLDEVMRTQEAAQALASARQGTDAVARASAARTLVTKIGDGSNLILDPDLDSFYVMDAVVVKLPDLAEQAGKLARLARAHQNKPSLTAAEKADFLVEQGKFRGSAEGLTASLNSAFAANADGATRAALTQAAQSLTQKVEAFVKASDVVSAMHDAGRRDAAGLTAFLQSEAEMLSGANGLWQDSAAELDRLLAVRIGGFWTNLVAALGTALLVTGAAFLLAWLLTRSIVRSLAAIDARIRELADMSLDASVPEAQGHDEIAELARAVVYFRDRTVEKLDDASSDERKRELIARERTFMGRIAERIRLSVGGGVAHFQDVASSMRGSTTRVQSHATTTSERLSGSMTDLHTSSQDMTNAASAVTELSASIAEIASQTAQSMSVMREAQDQVALAQKLAASLSEASDRIGSITALINGIAEQTNLLALNATIEAARAGAAGRGFAVVASEVKLLAGQTTKATGEIAQQVAALKAVSADVLQAIGRISRTVVTIGDVTSSVASAVEEQNAATSELNQTVLTVVDRTRIVIEGLNALPSVAIETDRLATELASSAGDLTQEAERLEGEVSRLVREIADQRKEERRRAEGEASLQVDGRRYVTRVHDISTAGIRLDAVDAGLGKGKAVTLDLGDGVALNAHVVWIDNERMGLMITPDRVDAAAMSRLVTSDQKAA